MKSIPKVIWVTFFIVVIVFSMAACKGPEEPEISPLTGTVSISGTAQVGQPLTANTSSLGGSGTISYQWKRGTTNIGTNSNIYTVHTADVGSAITVTVTRDGYSGSVISNTLMVMLVNAKTPAIASQPVDITVSLNASNDLSIMANSTDSGYLSYQWYSNTSASNSGGVAIVGATSATYYPSTDIAGTYFYFVEVTNTIPDNGDGGNKTASIRSNAVTLIVNEKVNAQIPIITTQPVGGTVKIEGTRTISVEADTDDDGTLSYQWYSSTSASNNDGSPIFGTIYADYNLPTDTAGTFYYFVEITNTISDNGDSGNKTASVRSDPVTWTILQQADITIINYWADDTGSISIGTSAGEVIANNIVYIAPTQTITFTPNADGYSNHSWTLNGNSDGNGVDYTFNANVMEPNKNYNIGLRVQKNGNYYFTQITVKMP
jgi:hypothetical protein